MEDRSTAKGMTRGQLASRTGCNPETIRYYERVGLMPSPARSESGYRQYDPPHEQRLRFIMRGRELGFSIGDIEGLLDLVDSRAVSCAEVKGTAQAHLDAVRDKIADLKRMESVLADTVRSCSGADVPECPLIDTLFDKDGVDAGKR
ncbi:MAG: helix-turn-helix domain-containing protein [Woeseia sp.]